MIDKQLRVGNFTSSGIAALMNGGKRAKTYIEECNMERRLGRSIETDTNAKPLSWGKLVEKRAFDLLGMEYMLCSEDTLSHPEFDFWTGTPDATKIQISKTVSEIKCPFTLKSFCLAVDPFCKDGELIYPGLTIEALRANHDKGEDYYWQTVSNGILTNSKFGELIIYMPTHKELDIIREMASNVEEDQNKYAWIFWGDDKDLPYIPEGSEYKNLNIIRFEIPESDKELMTKTVKQAGEFLI